MEVKDVLARAQQQTKLSQPALAKLVKIASPSDAIVSENAPELKLKWDASFVDEELEHCYFLEWWVPRCNEMVRDGAFVAVILGLVIPLFTVCFDHKNYLISQLVLAIQVVLGCSIAASQMYPSLLVNRFWKSNVLMVGVFAIPLVVAWIGSVLFERGAVHGGWCELSAYDGSVEVLCNGVRTKKLPQEMILACVMGAFVVILYTNISWMFMGFTLAGLCAMFFATLGGAPGTGCSLLLLASMAIVMVARRQEISHRRAFLLKQHMSTQANVIGKYSEALMHQGVHTTVGLQKPSFNDYGVGMGTGHEMGSGSPQSLDDPVSFDMMTGYPPDSPGPVSTHEETMQRHEYSNSSKVNFSSAYSHQPPSNFEESVSKRARVDSDRQMQDLGMALDGSNTASGQQQYEMLGSSGVDASIQLCMQWGLSGPAVLEVSHDVLMLVDGTSHDILVGNVHLGRLEAILGLGNKDIGRQILRNHVATQLRIMGSCAMTSYDSTIFSMDGSPRHMNCIVSARDRSKIVWSMQDTALQQELQARHNKMMTAQLVLDLMRSCRDGNSVPDAGKIQGHLDIQGQLDAVPCQPCQEPISVPQSACASPHDNMQCMSADTAVEAIEASLVADAKLAMSRPTGCDEIKMEILDQGMLCESLDDSSQERMPSNGSSPGGDVYESTAPSESDSTKVKPRRPYRFCSRCWVRKSEWVLRSITLPHGRSTNLNGHTNDTCPMWPKGTAPTAEQNRAYAAGFKFAQRRSELHNVALKAFEELCPHLSQEELVVYLHA